VWEITNLGDVKNVANVRNVGDNRTITHVFDFVNIAVVPSRRCFTISYQPIVVVYVFNVSNLVGGRDV